MQVGAAMELLRPLLADITADGLSLVGEVTAEELGLTEDEAVVLGPLAVSLDLTNVEGLVAVTGVLEGTIIRECVRCLKEFEDPLAFSVRAAFIQEPKSVARHPKRVDPRRAREGIVEASLVVEGEAPVFILTVEMTLGRGRSNNVVADSTSVY